MTSVIARAIGARDKRRADSSAEHAVALGLLVSGAFTAGAYLFGESMLAGLGVPDKLMVYAWGYFRILASGYVFLVMSVFFRSILTGEGDTRTPVMIQGGGTLLNIALDPVFIFTFGLGVEGAAMATVISQALSAAVFVYLLFFREHTYVTFDLADFRYEREILTSIFRVGAPASFSFVVMATGGAFYNRLLVEYSEDTVAAFQVGTRIDHIFLLPVIATAAGIMTLVGMFQGAKRYDLTRGIVGYAISRSLVLSAVMGTLFYAGAPVMLGWFSDSPTIVAAGVGYLRVSVFSYPFVVVVMLTGRILQGMGQGSPVLILSVLRVVLLSGPFAYAFVFWMNKPVGWVWWAIVSGMAATAVIATVWLRREILRSEDAHLPGVAAEAAVS